VAESVLNIEGLVKRYGGSVEAVRGIDLDIRAGEVFGFLGPNGAGKSTTIRCVLGLLAPTAGRMTAFGVDLVHDGVAVRKRIAYVPGELRLPERMTGAQLAATIGEMRGGFEVGRQHQLVERLTIDMERPIRSLSTGNRRKIALLLAFASNADLLILDEPTSGLDPLMQREFLVLVREAKARGATTFLSSHVLSEVQHIADRVAVLRSGKVVATGTVDELRRSARQRVEVWFEDQPSVDEFAGIAGLAEVRMDDGRLTAVLTGSVQPLLQCLVKHRVASILVEEPDLEDAFLDLYTAPVTQ
jgi:ABC-2 type transport system ATP-binding protein